MVIPLAADRGRPTSNAEGPREALQNDKTNPMLIWEGFVDHPILECWCRLSQNLPNEPSVNLDKVCGLDRLVIGFHPPGKMMQTKPILPEWRSDGFRGLMRNEQKKPILPEWQPGPWPMTMGGARTKPKATRSHSRCRANEANNPDVGSEICEPGHMD